jgi:hypothetical protein
MALPATRWSGVWQSMSTRWLGSPYRGTVSIRSASPEAALPSQRRTKVELFWPCQHGFQHHTFLHSVSSPECQAPLRSVHNGLPHDRTDISYTGWSRGPNQFTHLLTNMVVERRSTNVSGVNFNKRSGLGNFNLTGSAPTLLAPLPAVFLL